jgi:hypothetical protein
LHIHNVMFGINFMQPCPKEDCKLLMFTPHVKTTIVYIDLTYGSYTCALVVVQLWTLFTWLNITHWHAPNLGYRLKCKSEMKTIEEQEVEDTFPSSQHFGGKRACWSSGMGLGRMRNT